MSRKAKRASKGKCEACGRLSGKGSPFEGMVQPGKQALEAAHSWLVDVAVDCSVNVESAYTVHQKHGEKVFDYLVVLKEGCQPTFIEVHPASSSGSVEEMIAKKEGTRRILGRTRSPVTDGTWHWIVPGQGTIAFKGSDRFGKRLAEAKIKQPARKMREPD